MKADVKVWCLGKERSSCPTNDTLCVILILNSVIRHTLRATSDNFGMKRQKKNRKLDTVLCISSSQLFSPGTPVSSINKTYLPDITRNIVESGVKHYSPKPNPTERFLLSFNL